MTTGELWWNRLVNSVRFLDDVKDVIMDGKSVIMNFPDEIPWKEEMTVSLEQQLAFMTDTRSFEVHDAARAGGDPGKYLFERFCSESERKKYWPARDKSHECFLAANNNTTLNHRIICVTGINQQNAASWLKSVTEYLEHRGDGARGIFILAVQGINTNESALMGNVRYSDYVTDYDCMMLCLTLLSSARCSSAQKRYISELAGNIALNNVKTAGQLAAAGLELAMDPYVTACEVLSEEGALPPGLRDRVQSAVWETQIRFVFPQLEYMRRDLIHKYGARIQQYLNERGSAVTGSNKASDLEIGELYYICKGSRLIEKPDFEQLKKMRDARNFLAHMDILTYDMMRELSIL